MERNSVLEKANRRSLLRSVALQACEEQSQIPQAQRRRKFLGVHAGNKSEQQALSKYAIRPCQPRFHGESISEVSYGAFYDTNFQNYRNILYETSSAGGVCTEPPEEPEQNAPPVAAAGPEKGLEKKLHLQVKLAVVKQENAPPVAAGPRTGQEKKLQFQVKSSVVKQVKRLKIFETDD